MEYIKIPKQISYHELLKNTSFSALNYLKVLGINENVIPLKDLLSRPLTTRDKGVEVGSQSYIHKSEYFFTRTKSLQPDYLLPMFTGESTRPILPSVFVSANLKEGDILISKDSNIGETVILDADYPNYALSGGIYKLPIIDNRHYIFAFLKNDFFKTQLNFLASKGSIIRHAKTLFLDCKIPFPNKNSDKVIAYVEVLVKALINKEKVVKKSYAKIIERIDFELKNNQKKGKFIFNYPTLEDLIKLNRINAGVYSEYFKEQEFKIKNYKYGYKSIKELGFNISRGQNLQVSAIGKSVYSDVRKNNFYTLILPKNISLFGVVKKYEYLGSQGRLKTLKAGDVIFGAEGFEKGRSIVIFEDQENAITNIHGITLNHSESNITLSVFVKCFLDYLRTTGLIDLYAAGGNGGSLSKHYWKIIPFPNFPDSIQKELVSIYSKPLNHSKSTIKNFIENEADWDSKAGIVQIDESYKKIKLRLEKVVTQIINDEEVEMDLSFLN